MKQKDRQTKRNKDRKGTKERQECWLRGKEREREAVPKNVLKI